MLRIKAHDSKLSRLRKRLCRCKSYKILLIVGCLTILHIIVSGAVRRRRGPNVNNLFKSNSLRSPDSTDKENECSGMRTNFNAPSLPSLN